MDSSGAAESNGSLVDTAASTAPEPVDFFVSYNAADADWAEWAAWILEEAGYTVFIQAWDFRPGHNFVILMQQATIAAKRTLLVLSDSYLRALFTQPEWGAAFAADPTGSQRRIVPVRVRPCTPDGLLKTIIHIDLLDCEEHEAKRRLLDGVRLGRAKPRTKPLFPGLTAAGERPTGG